MPNFNEYLDGHAVVSAHHVVPLIGDRHDARIEVGVAATTVETEGEGIGCRDAVDAAATIQMQTVGRITLGQNRLPCLEGRCRMARPGRHRDIGLVQKGIIRRRDVGATRSTEFQAGADDAASGRCNAAVRRPVEIVAARIDDGI